jgi:folate-binding protein YgfZ
MLKTLRGEIAATPLPDLGAVRVQGPDALKFLQGQLSNDTEQLPAVRSQLAGLHTAQGRVIALLRLVLVAPDDVLAILPRELAAPVTARLSKYVLRAKAKVTDASAEWVFAGVGDAAALGEGSFAAPITPGRVIVGSPTGSPQSPGGASQTALGPSRPAIESSGSAALKADELRERWRAFDIADGIPQVYAATTEAFIAQMLNLDVLGAISFEKGCYTGQEIVARAHYRGRVKRRMQRFRTRTAAAVAIGDNLRLSDGRSTRVVDAVALGDGRYEFLAVANLAATASADESNQSSSETLAQTATDVESLPLPYELPE